MRPQSAKAKGRRLQQWVRDQLIEHLEVHPVLGFKPQFSLPQSLG